jgi:glycosyltransferase involved in cell wall biosynthesis
MRIAFVSVSSQIGGSEVLLLQLMKELRSTRPAWKLHLILPANGPLAVRAASLDVAVSIVPIPAALIRLGEGSSNGSSRASLFLRLARAAADVPGYQRRLSRAVAAIDPDILHSNGFKAHIVTARLNRGRAALVWHIHEYVAARPVTRLLVRHYAGRADVIVANSRSVGDDVRTVIGSDVRVIHNAVDLERFCPTGAVADLDASASMSPAPSGTVRVGLVATFGRWKGHETFLRSMALLDPAGGVRGYVVGGALYDTDGSQHTLAELQERAAALSVSERVGFTGFVEAPETALRALDIVVHASTEPEAFGLVIAEGMACGRAVITSGTGGSAELVRDGEDAVVHAAANHVDLAARVAQLAADQPMRERLGAQARATALRRFDARRLADQFAAVYDDARTMRARG